MKDYKPSFIGSVLKVIACTPNFNDDFELYESEVIKPTEALRKRSEKMEDTPLDQQEIGEILSKLSRILEIKKIDNQERHDRFEEVLELHDLKDQFSEYLSAH